MKNIHILPTDKPSRLDILGMSNTLQLFNNLITFKTFERSTQHIYITSDEEIKEGDWFISLYSNSIQRELTLDWTLNKDAYKKIILTTDQYLIAEGIQQIDDEFLEWFVKNPSCESVEVKCYSKFNDGDFTDYKIIIPKEEQKQHIVDMMQADEELELYDEDSPAYNH